jgi:glycosyltransferase involved in cell wall biosynthesis
MPGRIAIATESVNRDGGVGVYVQQLVDALQAAGYEVRLIVGEAGNQPSALTVPGLERRELTPKSAGAYEQALADFAPDVVHVHHLYDPRIVALTRAHAPLVWGVHDYMCSGGSLYFRPGHECGRGHGPGCVPRLVLRGCGHSWNPRGRAGDYRLVGRLVALLRDVDVALAFSTAILGNLRANQVEGVAIAPFVAGRVEVAAPGLGDRILYVGRVTRHKGLGQLIRAVGSIENAMLEVSGEGWWKPAAQKLVARLGLQSRVRFLGWLAPSELDAAYRRAGVVAVPSLWPEPFGMVGLEAMARGRPVVGTATGGIPDWLADGETGLLTPPGDVRALAQALERLLGDPELRTRMGAAGAEHVRRRFTAKVHIARIEEINQLAQRRWTAQARAVA